MGIYHHYLCLSKIRIIICWYSSRGNDWSIYPVWPCHGGIRVLLLVCLQISRQCSSCYDLHRHLARVDSVHHWNGILIHFYGMHIDMVLLPRCYVLFQARMICIPPL